MISSILSGDLTSNVPISGAQNTLTSYYVGGDCMTINCIWHWGSCFAALWSTLLLPLLPGSLRPRVIVSFRVSSMYQIDISFLNFWDKARSFLSLRVFIFIVISTTFRSIFPLAFCRFLSFTELRTTSFIEPTGVACSDSVSHNQVQVLSIPVLLLACSQVWTCDLQMIVPLEA